MVKHINIEYKQSCTWELDGGVFFCAHDESEIVECVEDHLGFDGYYQTMYRYYACVECGSSVPGNPDEEWFE